MALKTPKIQKKKAKPVAQPKAKASAKSTPKPIATARVKIKTKVDVNTPNKSPVKSGATAAKKPNAKRISRSVTATKSINATVAPKKVIQQPPTEIKPQSVAIAQPNRTAKKSRNTNKATQKTSAKTAEQSDTRSTLGAAIPRPAPEHSVTPYEFEPYQHVSSEGYMNDTQLTHFRTILETWKKELMQEVDNTIIEMKEASVTVLADPNDRATQEETFNLELRTRDRERKLIRKIEEALAQIDNKEYGYCETCGEEIGIRRLEARPTAVLCIECKTLDEIREKRSPSVT